MRSGPGPLADRTGRLLGDARAGGADTRLLLPALVAWAAVAATLGTVPGARVLGGGLSVAGAVLVGWAPRRFRGRGAPVPGRADAARTPESSAPDVVRPAAEAVRAKGRGRPADWLSTATALDGPAARGAAATALDGPPAWQPTAMGRDGPPVPVPVAEATGPLPGPLIVEPPAQPAVQEVSRSGRWVVALVLATTGLCLCASGLQGLLRSTGRLPALAEAGATVRLTGSVASDPRSVVGRASRGDDLVLVRLSVLAVEGRGSRSKARGQVLVFGGAQWSAARWGTQLEARGRLAPALPGDDVVATLDARGGPLTTRPAGPVARAAERLRVGLRRACEGLSPDPRGLLPGLVVGDTSAQPADLGEAMKATGLTHLSAVSGTNMTIVCALALGLGRAAGLGRRLRLTAAALVLAGFVVLARPEPSVLRAAVMGALGLLAFTGARSRSAMSALSALSAAVVLLLVYDPWLARSYGFALSVLATGGLLLFAAPWSRWLSRWVPAPLAVALAVPAAAQVACAPVLVLLAGQISLVALPANVLCEPLVAPATVLGLAAALVSMVSPTLAAALAHVGGWACALIALTARRLADVPGGQLPWPGGGLGAVSLAVVTLVLVLGLPPLVRRVGEHPRGAALVACGVVALGAAARAPVTIGPTWPPPGWVLVACDVGQGDALVLSTAPGRAVLVDAGPDPAAIDACLRRLDVRALDAIVLTHFHADHVDGLRGALRRRPAAELVVTLVDDPPAQARAVRSLARAAGLQVRTAAAGERRVAGQLEWLVLAPLRVIHDGSVPNNASIVLLVRSRGLRLLLLGDVEPAADRVVARALATAPGGSRVDVLKVAHHGSALQDPALIAAAAPRLALVSVGADNDYGHPAPGTLRLLAGTGAAVARTDRDGDLAVVASASGPRLIVSGPRPHRDAPADRHGHG